MTQNANICGRCGHVALILNLAQCPNCGVPIFMYELGLRKRLYNTLPLDHYSTSNEGVTNQIGEIKNMPELGTKIRVLPDQAKEPGIYKIQPGTYVAQQTRQGQAIILTVTKEGDASGKMMSLFVPFYAEPTQRTNLARLLAGWGSNTDKWVGKRVKIEKDSESGKAKLSPA